MQMTIKVPFGTLEWQLEENDIKQLPKEPSQDSIKYSDLSLGRAPPKSFFFSVLVTKIAQLRVYAHYHLCL